MLSRAYHAQYGRVNTLDFQGFYQSLKENRIDKLYVFSGQEEFIKVSALRDLRKKILPEGLEDMNETLLDNPSVMR